MSPHTYIYFRIIRQRPKHIVQRLIHLLGRALEEPSAAADEQRVAREHRPVVAVFEEVAYAVLGMAGGVQGFDLDAVAEGEGRVVAGRVGDVCAVLAADYGERVVLELKDCRAY